MKLEDIKTGLSLEGVEPAQVVTVVATVPQTDSSFNVTHGSRTIWANAWCSAKRRDGKCLVRWDTAPGKLTFEPQRNLGWRL
jgi:hypothetical protein